MRTILAISPHPDDEALGCGGALARYAEEGCAVHVIALSDCHESLPPGFSADALIAEHRAAICTLGAQSLGVDEFSVRTFPEQRQAILERLCGLRDEIRPDLVFVPALSDRHQDHWQVAMEALRAFRCSIWGYVTPWNTLDSHVRGFVRLEDWHVEKKIASAQKYASQGHRPYMDPEVIRAWARTVGLQAGSTWAEGYEILREVN